MEKKASYLKYLKVSTKFLDACNCPDQVHSYCLSALVTRKKKIYCHTCSEPYKYFIKEEKLCNPKLFKIIAIYVLVFLVSLTTTIGLMIFDGYLKFNHIKKNPADLVSFFGRKIENDNLSFWYTIRWNLLIPVSIIILFILIWCFYFTYQDEIALR
jgi:hypothetical protein